MNGKRQTNQRVVWKHKPTKKSEERTALAFKMLLLPIIEKPQLYTKKRE